MGNRTSSGISDGLGNGDAKNSSYEAVPLMRAHRTTSETSRYSLISFDVPLDLSLTISPLEKFRKYRKFPFKFLLHVLIIAFSCAGMISRNIEYADFIASTSTTLRITLGCSVDPLVVGPQGTTSYYSSAAVYEGLQSALTGFYNLPNSSLSTYVITPEVAVIVKTTQGYEFFTSTVEDPTGFLTEPVFKTPQRILHILLRYHFVNFLRELDYEDQVVPFMDATLRWVAEADYDFSSGSGRASYDITFTNTIERTSKPTLIVLASFIMVFCLLSLFLTIKALVRCAAAYQFAKENLRGSPRLNWETLSFYDKLAFFNVWHVVSAVGDILLFIGCGFTLARQRGTVSDILGSITPENGLRAFGIFCNFISLLKYCEWHIQFYSLVLAVKASLPRVIRFILTVSPIFVAFALVGVSCFSEHAALFGDFGRACRTLFCLLCGDSVLGIFEDLTSSGNTGYRIFAQCYLYSFCVMFITTILNVFIFIIESGYEVAKRTVYGPCPEPTLRLDHERLEAIFDAVRSARSSSQLNDSTGAFHREQVLDDGVRAMPHEHVSLVSVLEEIRRLRDEIQSMKTM